MDVMAAVCSSGNCWLSTGQVDISTSYAHIISKTAADRRQQRMMTDVWHPDALHVNTNALASNEHRALTHSDRETTASSSSSSSSSSSRRLQHDVSTRSLDIH